MTTALAIGWLVILFIMLVIGVIWGARNSHNEDASIMGALCLVGLLLYGMVATVASLATLTG